MTNSNVSNLLVKVNSINVEVQSNKVDASKQAGLFENTLKNIAGSNAKATDTKATDKKASAIEKSTLNNTDKLVGTKDNKLAGNDEKIDDVNSQLVEKIEDAVAKIEEVIEGELDVSKEEIEKALETLGLTFIDLFNPQNLAEVVAKLTGEEESIVLVMSDEFKTILDSVNDIANQLISETNKSFEELKEVFNTFIEPKEETIVNPEDVPFVEPEMDVNNEPEEKLVVTIEKPGEAVVKEQLKEAPDKEPQIDNQNEDVSETITKVSKDNPNSQASDNNDESFVQTKAFQPEVKQAKESEIKNEGIIFAEPKFEITFSPEENIVALPTGETVRAEEIVNQLVEQARVISDAETTTMEMTLNPEGLGKIFMEITQKGSEITAKIFTENDAVKQALESQMANLKIEMNQSSTKITSIEVSVGTHEFERNLEQDARNQQERQSREESSRKQTRGINLNSLDELSGLMSEEEQLIARMMQDNGNTLDYQA